MVKEFKEKKIIVSLRRAFDKPVTKRARATLFVLKNAVRKETRAEEIKISNKVNEYLWEKGRVKGKRKITIKAVKTKEGVTVYLPEEKVVEKKKQVEKKATGLKGLAEEKMKKLQKEEPKKVTKEKKVKATPKKRRKKELT